MTDGPVTDGPEKAGPEKASPEKASPEKAGPEKASPEKAGPEKAGPGRAIAALREELAGVDPEAFRRAVEAAADARMGAFFAGIQAYRAHPYRRRLRDPPALWREGTSCLRDYGADAGGASKGPRATPLLVVPSLVNRAQILDLTEKTSLLRWLAAQGFRPFLLDWDRPGELERGFALGDYIAGRLERALDAVLAETGRRPCLLGYCMGGLLALALALRRPEDLRALVLLATPWDFHAGARNGGGHAQARLLGASMAPLAPLIEARGELPVEVIQGLFALLDPLLAVRKFVAFSRLDRDSARAADFVALEDWVNDGVPLAAPVARECLEGWYRDNSPARGLWRVAGRPVLPEQLDRPVLCVVPGADRIVPPASARALAARLPAAELLCPAAGHVGMVVGGGAARRVWQPLAHWLRALDS